MKNKIFYHKNKMANGILGSFLISIFILSPFTSVMASFEVVDGSSQSPSETSSDISNNEPVSTASVETHSNTVAVQVAPVEPVIVGNPITVNPVQTTNLPGLLSVNITANPREIEMGGSSILIWVAQNAVSCTSSNFNTYNAVSGMVSVQPPITTIGGTFTYSITCTDAFGNIATDSDTITVNRAESPVTTVVPACVMPTTQTNVANPIVNQTSSVNVAGNPIQAFVSQTVNDLNNNLPVSIQPVPTTIPSVTILAVPSEIELQGQSMLVWYAPDAVSCTSSDFNTHGTKVGVTFVRPPITVVGGTYTYSVNCVNALGQTATDSVTIAATRPASPVLPLSVAIEALPAEIELNGHSLLVWVANSALSCSSANFDTRGATSGFVSVNPNISNFQGTQTYSIECIGSGSTTNDSSLAPAPGVVTDSVTITANRVRPPQVVQTCATPVNTVATINQVSVDLSANPTEIQVGGSSTLTWSSQNAVACTSETLSNNATTHAVALNGSVSVTPAITAGQSITHSITCVNLDGSTATDSATITAITTPGGGGNGGGGSGGGSNGGNGGGSNRNNGIVLGASTGPIGASCSYIRDFMRMDWENNPAEVMKLQSFLKDSQKLDVDVNGIFDQKTFTAVSAFQDKYKADILSPWGHTDATGFVYMLTRKKINELHCNTTISLTVADKQEIDSFRNYLLAVLSNGLNNPVGGSMEEANVPVWSIKAEDLSANDEPASSEVSSEDTSIENQATADVSNNGGFWNFVKGLFGAN
ncbi:MAG: hypothetical protein AAB534_00420 [Patescibacteria group bacterium]